MASVGGWTYSQAMHKFMSTPEDRLKLSTSCVNLIKKYPEIFDGLDIDLEYPCPAGANICGPGIPASANDPPNFTALMKQFRDLMPEPLLLSIATSANPTVIPGLQLPLLNPLLSHYNIMTYDFVSGSFGDVITGHQSRVMKAKSPLSANNNVDPSISTLTPTLGWFLSIEEAVDLYISQGAQMDKLNIGVAMYGRGFKIEAGSGIYRKSLGGLDYGTWEINNFDYRDLKLNYMANDVCKFDQDAMSPYILDGRFITFDDPKSIQAKLDLIKQKGLGGIFGWELTGDTDDYELLTAMNEGKRSLSLNQNFLQN